MADSLRIFRAKPSESTLFQSTIIYDINGNQMVYYIGRFEDLQNNFDYIMSKIGLDSCTLPIINRTEHKHYQEMFTPCGKEKVAEIWRKDIENFKYSFE